MASGTRRESSWGGASSQQGVAPRHRWQQGWSGRSELMVPGAGGTLRISTLVWSLVAVAALAFFLYVVLNSPPQTPCLTIFAPAYGVPFEPFAWSQEDQLRFKGLDKETLSVLESRAWRNKQRALDDFQRQLDVLAQSRADSVIIVVAMHGAVDDNGKPCLIPPGASPTDSLTWLPLETLLQQIKEVLPARQNKLLVLDATRTRAAWSLGQVTNGFVPRMEDAVKEAGLANLAVLSASSEQQTSWTSPSLQGSSFLYFLFRGLAGEADDDWREGIPEMESQSAGDRDGRVTLSELHQYLSYFVNEWAIYNRASFQTPKLIQTGGNFVINRGLRASVRRQTLRDSLSPASEPHNVAQEQRDRLSRSYASLHARGLYRFDPVAEGRLGRRISLLTRYAAAGQAYSGAAAQMASELEDEFEEIDKRLEACSAYPRSVPHQARVFRPSTRPVDSADTPSLALSESLGGLRRDQAATHMLALLDFASADDGVQYARDLLGEKATRGRSLTQLAWQVAAYREVLRRQRPDLIKRTLQTYAQAQQLVVPWRANAQPGDERVQYWLRASVLELNAGRRAAQDELFAGWRDPEELLQDVEGRIRRAEDLRQAVTSAYALRDRVWSEIGFDAQWVTAPESDWNRDRPVSVLLQLINETRRLDAVLGQPPSQQDPMRGASASLSRVVEQVELLKQAVDGARRQAYEDLLEQEELDSNDLREMRILLDHPINPARSNRLNLDGEAMRRKLGQRAEAADSRLNEEFVKYMFPARRQLRLESLAEPSVDRSGEYLDQLSEWDWHPLERLLDREASPTEGGPDPSQEETESVTGAESQWLTLNARLRYQLSRLTHLSSDESSDSQSDANSTDPRNALRKPALALRRAATLWFTPPMDDLVGRLRDYDLQMSILDLADDAIEDFYAANPAFQAPYFQTAAEQLINLAGVLATPIAAIQARIEATEGNLSASIVAAQRAIAIETTVSPAIEDPNLQQVTVRVRQEREGLPDGDLAVFLMRDGDYLENVRFLVKDSNRIHDQLSAPLPQTMELEATTRADEMERDYSVVVYYRGHLFRDLFQVASRGTLLEYRPYRPTRRQVSVSGTGIKQPSIVMVLDASQSMGRRVFVEADGQNTQPRLTAAREAFTTVLNRLDQQGDPRVGVLFLGHRVGWRQEENPIPEFRIDYPGPIPDDLMPSTDVEVVLPVGLVTPTAKGAVARRLRTLVPWGQSPLHLALLKACEMLSGEDLSADKHVIVVTDGMNYQFPKQHVSQEAVVEAARQVGARVHVVGFGLHPESQAESIQAFQQLADSTGGMYRGVAEAVTLVTAMQQLLDTGRYYLEAGNRVVGEATLGSPVTIPDHIEADSFLLRYGQARESLSLSPGDFPQLSLNATNDEFRALAYDNNLPVESALVEGMTQKLTPYVVRVHRPQRKESGVEFEVSFQNNDLRIDRLSQRYTPQLVESWIEIRPVATDRLDAFPAFVFYDLNPVPDLPVPVHRWTVPNWPAEATRAKVEVWFQLKKTEPNQRISLSSIASDPERFANPQPVSEVNGIQLACRIVDEPDQPLQVFVVEYHESDPPDLATLKVAIDSPFQPRHVAHSYSREQKRVMHVYEFARSERSRLLESGEIQVTARRRLHADALRLPSGKVLETEIGSRAGVVPATAE